MRLWLWVRRVDWVGVRWVRPAHRPGVGAIVGAIVSVIAAVKTASIASPASRLREATEASALGQQSATYPCED